MSDKSNNPSRRDQIRKRQQRQQAGTRNIFIVVAALLFGVVGYLVWQGVKPPPDQVGIEVEIMENSDHVEDGTVVEYSTNPPNSGPHYLQPMPAGFYNVGEVNAVFPESNIMHSLEHGYVVFWYNCSILSVSECEQLKAEIQEVIDAVGQQKVIVFPWNSINEPLVMTSWGVILRFASFDVQLATDFVIVNRSSDRAPEPFAN